MSTNLNDQPEVDQRQMAEQAWGKEEADRLFSQEDVANAIYKQPAEVQLDSVDVAMKTAYASRADDHLMVLGRTDADRVARDQAFTEDIVRKPGFEPYGLGKMLYEHAVNADIADTRGEPDVEDAQLVAWNEEARRALVSRFDGGPARVEDLLARSKKFTEAHPKLHELLGRRGIGSRADIVLAIVEHIWETDYR
jgi:hypothetical protein